MGAVDYQKEQMNLIFLNFYSSLQKTQICWFVFWENLWQANQRTEVRFASLLSGGFTTMAAKIQQTKIAITKI